MQSKDLFANIAFWLRSRTTVELPERTLDDLLSYTVVVAAEIKRAKTEADLKRCTDLTDLLYPGFYHLERCAYHLNKLHTAILQRRCELIGQQYANHE